MASSGSIGSAFQADAGLDFFADLLVDRGENWLGEFQGYGDRVRYFVSKAAGVAAQLTWIRAAAFSAMGIALSPV